MNGPLKAIMKISSMSLLFLAYLLACFINFNQLSLLFKDLSSMIKTGVPKLAILRSILPFVSFPSLLCGFHVNPSSAL